MRIHFIGIGERIMSDLAVVLSAQGQTVTGSDEAFDTHALQRLESNNLMPKYLGWFPQKLAQGLDMVIVGSQVSTDNPELKAAQHLDLPICSYPAHIYAYARDKQRIVITGEEEEKNLICTLILHVLRYLHKAFDYVVDAPTLVPSVQLSDAPIIILKSDALPSSPIDLQPKSLHYQHNIVLLSGIRWKANTTYPTLESYLRYVNSLADASPKGGTLIYYEEDTHVKEIGSKPRADVKNEPYKAHPYRHEQGKTYLITPQDNIPFLYTDMLSMRAVAGVQQLTRNLAVTDQQFYEALATFRVDHIA